MPRSENGFSLVEVMIVVAVIAIIAAIAAPNLLSARLSANETAAIATVRTVSSAQAQFLHGASVDTDGDGLGEFGGLLELSGAAAGRQTGARTPAVLSGYFRKLNGFGAVSRGGYLFRVFLPAMGGFGAIGEPHVGFANDGSLDYDLTETCWCIYAWPAAHNQSGNRTFFVNQAGDVLAAESSIYSGPNGCPAADAAFTTPGITGQLAMGAVGQDGNTWSRVN